MTINITDQYNAYHYPADTFKIRLHGISIEEDQISQSMTLYLKDSSSNYVIEKGTRIMTTTVARPETIEIQEIVYNWASPLSANKISITFFLPRTIYDDERIGFILGKDLSDVNLEIKRLKLVLTRLTDNYVIRNTNEMII